MSDKSNGNPNTRTRRSSQEIRSLLLTAARELFVSGGYEGTTTLDISRRAGVAEKLLFNNFGSKAELFEAAILTSFADFVDAYRDAWASASADSTAEERVELLVSGLFELAETNRVILRSAVGSAENDRTGPQAELLRRWAATLQSWTDIAETVRDARGLTIDPPASIAAVGAMVFGMALLDDLLFPDDAQQPSRERRVAAMTDLVLHGTLHARAEDRSD